MEQALVDFFYEIFMRAFSMLFDVISYLDGIFTYLGDFVAIAVNGVELFIEFINNFFSQSGLLFGFVAILPPVFFPFFFITLIGMVIRCIFGGG